MPPTPTPPPDIKVQMVLLYLLALLYASFCQFHALHGIWAVQLATLAVPEYWDIGVHTATFCVGVAYLPYTAAWAQYVYAAIYGGVLGIWLNDWWGGLRTNADGPYDGGAWFGLTLKQLGVVTAHLALMRGSPLRRDIRTLLVSHDVDAGAIH